MSLLKNKLSLLKSTRYLEASMGASNLSDIELLENGKRLRQQIEKQCSKARGSIGGKDLTTHFVTQQNELLNFKDIHPRLRFIYTNEFRYNMQLLRKASKKAKGPDVIKTISNGLPYNELEDMPLQFKDNNGENFKLFITDHFFHTASGLAMLYNIQRERKIWWMRFSADPSRYYLEPIELENKQNNTNQNINKAQSITIKARLPFGDVGVEHITLVPLNETPLPNENEFEIYNDRTKKNQLPAVIRSVISLDVAACTLIFDGAANNKRENTLFLNRKLTPYQCFVTCFDKDENPNDLKDLCTHISNVVEQAGLRLLNMNEYIGSNLDLNNQLDLADKLGIPYTILVNSNSLLSGLLQLRNRDTTLNEAIHISDIPGYLLSIFQAN